MAQIVIYKGSYQYDAVNVFAECLGEGFRRLGKDVAFIDLKDRENLAENIQREFSKSVEFIVSFGGIGFEFKSGEKSLYGLLPFPFIALLVDHPAYFLPRFNLSNMMVTCMDRSHVKFMREYFGEEKKVFFLPHGGCLSDAPDSQRTIDILFAGTYLDPDLYYGEIKALEEVPGKLALEASELILSRNCMDIEDALAEVSLKYGIDFNEKKHFQKKIYESIVTKIEIFIRAFKRTKILSLLDKCGFKMRLHGNGWKDGTFKNIQTFSPLPFKEVLNLMKQSKIVLNISCLSDGSHERVYSSMLNGAVSLTEQNPYLSEKFTDMEDIMFYKWLELGELPDKINCILSDCGKLTETARKGKEKAEKEHSWFSRAETLLKDVNDFKAGNKISL